MLQEWQKVQEKRYQIPSVEVLKERDPIDHYGFGTNIMHSIRRVENYMWNNEVFDHWWDYLGNDLMICLLYTSPSPRDS